MVGYDNGVNKLRLFDIESLDESIVKKGIDFDKEEVEKNLTLFLYPDDSDEAGNLLRIYQQYFMVSNAAQLILREMKEKKYVSSSLMIGTSWGTTFSRYSNGHFSNASARMVWFV
mgnify:CR=1 FL=1